MARPSKSEIDALHARIAELENTIRGQYGRVNHARLIAEAVRADYNALRAALIKKRVVTPEEIEAERPGPPQPLRP